MFQLQQKKLWLFTNKMNLCSQWASNCHQNVLIRLQTDCGLRKLKRFTKELRLLGNIETTIWNFRVGLRKNMVQRKRLRKDMPENLWQFTSIKANQHRYLYQHWNLDSLNVKRSHSLSKVSARIAKRRNLTKRSISKNYRIFSKGWKSFLRFT